MTAVAALGLATSLFAASASKIQNNGYVNGVPSVTVTCTNGQQVVIYKKNGTWYTGGLGHMGHKYDDWSMNRVANYVCTY